MATFQINAKISLRLFVEAEDRAEAEGRVEDMAIAEALEAAGLDVSDHFVEVEIGEDA